MGEAYLMHVIGRGDRGSLPDACDTVKAFYFVGQKFRRLKTTDIFMGT